MINEINEYLLNHYGRTPEGLPYFRLIFSTGITEKRYSEFHDYHGDIFIRAVREVREVLKYPFAQDRYILERIREISQSARELGLRSDVPYSYEEVYTFQDKNGNFLHPHLDKVEAALYLFFTFYVRKSWKERADLRMEILAKKELEKKRKNREIIGEGQSPYGFVLEGIKK